MLKNFMGPWMKGSTERFWISECRSWAPGILLNASFSWYRFGDFMSVHRPEEEEIVVVKLDLNAAVW